MSRNLAAVLLSACATTSTTADKPGARGPTAADHLAAAHQHDELARQQWMYPDSRHDSTGAQASISGAWTRTWDTSQDHDRLARIHRSAAAQLHAEYDEACGSMSPTDVSVSPLQRYGIGGTPFEHGAIIYLSPEAGPPERLLRDMRCHRAWMMLGPSGMDDCPLDLAGIQVTARGDAKEIAVTIKVRDAALVDELHRRTALELEMAEQHHTHER